MGASNVKWVRLGDYIEQCDERNSASINYPVIGINRDKTFMPTVANLDGVDIEVILTYFKHTKYNKEC